ncbi:TPA: RNA pyrophosphohydrolase [Pasteurella multocida]|nr:RNA pyrophosphohydrolase [Pasteurella multocida]
MIDFDGYRPNVGIVICNSKRQVLWAKRYGQNSWQFPQGGINDNESAEQAMYRELFEEVGLTPKDVKILYASKHWLRYKLPKRLLRYDSKPICIGQKQRWFLLQLVSDEKNIDMQSSKSPEFDGWRWVSFWYPVRQVVSFKKEVYRKAMKEFASVLFDSQNKEHISSVKQIENEVKPHNSHKKSSYTSKYSKRTYHKSRA